MWSKLYLTYAPGPPLNEYVDYFWLFDGGQAPRKERIVPSGTSELVINLRDDEIRIYPNEQSEEFKRFSGVVLSGTYSRIFVIDALQHELMLGVHFGHLFDRIGFSIIFVAFLVGASFAPLVFLGQFWLALIGMAAWGIGMGAQNSLLKAILTGFMPITKRSTGFGLFYTAYGIAWFLGSATMGFLYDKSITTLVIFSVVAQLAALPVFLWGSRASTPSRPAGPWSN